MLDTVKNNEAEGKFHIFYKVYYKVCPNEKENLAVVLFISIKSQCDNVFANR